MNRQSDLQRRVWIGSGVVAALVAAVGWVALLAAGCDGPSEPIEMERIASPRGDLDAVVQEVRGGATVSTSDVVSVTRTGASAASGTQMLVADKAWPGLKVKWVHDYLLEVRYEQAQIHKFTNFAYPGSPDPHPVVEVVLVKGPVAR